MILTAKESRKAQYYWFGKLLYHIRTVFLCLEIFSSCSGDTMETKVICTLLFLTYQYTIVCYALAINSRICYDYYYRYRTLCICSSKCDKSFLHIDINFIMDAISFIRKVFQCFAYMYDHFTCIYCLDRHA